MADIWKQVDVAIREMIIDQRGDPNKVEVLIVARGTERISFAHLRESAGVIIENESEDLMNILSEALEAAMMQGYERQEVIG